MKLAFQAPSPAMDPVASGDAEALVAAAYLEHRDELCRYLGRLVRDEVWAADLTQSAFERLLRAARAGQPPTNTRAWLVRVATNEFLSGYRHRKVAAAAAIRLPCPGVGDGPETSVVASESAAELHALIEALPRDQARALRMLAAGYSGKQVGDALGRSGLATRALIHRARHRVRAQLSAAAAPTA
jgi:RNA polymerase sigma factor (sigma-70 family)